MRLPLLLLLLLLVAGPLAHATTWDEPWQETVVKKADYLVLARVTAIDAQKGITATVLRSLGGEPLTGTVQINGFYSLQLCSDSPGEGPALELAGTDSCYFFLQKKPSGEYAIATPTTGYARVKAGQVAATYRHSYHQALVPLAVYESTMTAIFQHYHGQEYDVTPINSLISTALALPPAHLDATGRSTFFLQHAALETIYHLGLTTHYAVVMPFLRDTTNFHAQVSAARALTATPTPEDKQQLIKMLASKYSRDLAKVVAITTLAAYKPTELKPQLSALAQTASDEHNGFGGNIMDPRICTRVPSVKEALTTLVSGL
jgi:hypothetical protein